MARSLSIVIYRLQSRTGSLKLIMKNHIINKTKVPNFHFDCTNVYLHYSYGSKQMFEDNEVEVDFSSPTHSSPATTMMSSLAFYTLLHSEDIILQLSDYISIYQLLYLFQGVVVSMFQEKDSSVTSSFEDTRYMLLLHASDFHFKLLLEFEEQNVYIEVLKIYIQYQQLPNRTVSVFSPLREMQSSLSILDSIERVDDASSLCMLVSIVSVETIMVG